MTVAPFYVPGGGVPYGIDRQAEKILRRIPD